MSNNLQGSARWATVRNSRMTAKAETLTRTGSMPAAFLEWRTQSPIITYNSRAGAVISYNQKLIALALCYDNGRTGF